MAQHLEDREVGPMALVAPCGDARFRVERSPRRLRVELGGETLADSTRVTLLLEPGHLPVYYFPEADVRMQLLQPTEHTTSSPLKGTARFYTVRVGDRVAENAAWSYANPADDGPQLAGYVAFYWDMMDAWYEEDERAYAHARDPYKLIDVRQSSRHVRVLLGGEIVADSVRPRLLFETGLPTRYYLPPEDVRMDWLEPTTTSTLCAYKGRASYWRAHVNGMQFRDVAWSYRHPLPLAQQVRDYICFFQERVAALEVDGVAAERPPDVWE